MSYGEPDFSKFTREELVYVLLRVDRKKHPERVETIEALINKGVHPKKEEPETSEAAQIAFEAGIDALLELFHI